MPLEYQNQDSEQTLLEAIDEYHAHLEAMGRKILTDAQGADPIWLYHDATHAIFGQDTSLEEEAALDFWVLFGSDISWRLIRQYERLPEIKALNKAIIGQLGIGHIPLVYWRNRRPLWQVFRNTRQMTEKWPFQVPRAILECRLSELRHRYGIKVLTPEQRVPSCTTAFDYSIVSAQRP
jgi:hypothetical protein